MLTSTRSALFRIQQVSSQFTRPSYFLHPKRTLTMSDKNGGSIMNWVKPGDKSGEFKRQTSRFRNFISSEPGAKFPPEKDRYHLYVSYACPWAHRALIVRKLKGLDDIIPYTSVHYHLGEKGWRFVDPKSDSTPFPGAHSEPDPLHPDFTHLQDLYYSVDPNYSDRFTVPTLWDKKQNTIVSNESAEIIRMFYTAFDSLLDKSHIAPQIDLLPSSLEDKINAVNEWTYNDINNGVYKSGFATTQSAYENAVTTLFKSLDRAESDLSSSDGPYYFGTQLTEADVRLFTTIIRFDVVYVQHFKCNLRDIRSGYPNLHRWVRNLYWNFPDAFGEGTTQFEHIKKHYTTSHKQINPPGITPVGPVPDILGLDGEVNAVNAAVAAKK